MNASELVDRAINTLYKREEYYGVALKAAVEAEFTYKQAYAVAIRKSDGTSADLRKEDAMVACKDEYLAYLKAEAYRELCKIELNDCLAALSARQSILSYEVKVHGATAKLTP